MTALDLVDENPRDLAAQDREDDYIDAGGIAPRGERFKSAACQNPHQDANGVQMVCTYCDPIVDDEFTDGLFDLACAADAAAEAAVVDRAHTCSVCHRPFHGADETGLCRRCEHGMDR